ncbi:hypothetical protein H0H87_003879, partial [Tephrocybe sp. NHM501043]
MASTDNVLTTPELVSLIFEFSTKGSTANGMLVCTLWAGVGKPRLWRELAEDDIDGLLRLIVSWTYEPPAAPKLAVNNLTKYIEHFVILTLLLQIPRLVDWGRFLQYSSLVYHLSLDASVQSDKMNRVRATVLKFIAESHPLHEVFPNLQTLTCIAEEEEVFRPFIAVLHSGVTHLALVVPPASEMGGISTPVQSLFSLVYLEFYRIDIFDDLRPALAVFQQLPSLAIIVLPSQAATYAMLETLSKFPALEEIEISPSAFTSVGYRCNTKHPDSHSFDGCAFPVLTALTISGCPNQLSQLVDDENFPFHVQTLTIEIVQCRSDPVRALQKIAAKCSQVTNLTLLDTMDAVPSPFSLLRPFVTHNLTKLRVDAKCPLSYALSEIEELAQSLVMLEYLSLDYLVQETTPIPFNPALTFDHLPIFSRHCLKLSQFEINIDISQPCGQSLSDIVPFSALRELNLLGSFVYFRDLFNLESAATLLSELLPSYCRLTCEATIPIKIAGKAETTMVPEDAGKLNVWDTKRESIT